MPKVLLFITWGLYDWTWAAYELQIKINNSIHSKNQKTVWLTFSWKTSFVCLLSVIVNWWLSFINYINVVYEKNKNTSGIFKKNQRLK